MANFITQVEIGDDLYLIKDPEGSDKNVQDSSGTSKAYLLGHTSQNSTTTAVTNNDVYMKNGTLYTKELCISSVGSNHGHANIDASGNVVGEVIIDCSVNMTSFTDEMYYYQTTLTYANSEHDASTACIMLDKAGGHGTIRVHFYDGNNNEFIYNDFNATLCNFGGSDVVYAVSSIWVIWEMWIAAISLDSGNNQSHFAFYRPSRKMDVKSTFDASTIDMGYDNYYFNYNIDANTSNAIDILNIGTSSIGHLNYFKVVNTTNVSKTLTVTSSSSILKGGGNIIIPAQSLVEFSCTVTHGTSASDVWGILTHSDSIPL